MSTRILFIHGLASCGSGSKARALAAFFGPENLIAPDLPMDPDSAISALRRILSDSEVDLLVGSSLGGYYAMVLNRERPVPTVLINPTTMPWLSLRPHIGKHANWCTGEPLELTRDHLRQLHEMARRPEPGRESYLVFLGEGDEVLDYRVAANFFSDFQVQLIPDGDHRLGSFTEHLADIAAFRAAPDRSIEQH